MSEELYYNTDNQLYYRIREDDVVELAVSITRSDWMTSGVWTADEIRDNKEACFELYPKPGAKAYESELVTIEVPKKSALVGHIDELQRIITRRNKRIEELEAMVEEQEKEIAALNAEHDPVEPQPLAEPGLYQMRNSRLEHPGDRWLKTDEGAWYSTLTGRVSAPAETAAEWERENLSLLERVA